MGDSTNRPPGPVRLRCGIVLRVAEDACQVLGEGQHSWLRYAAPFPSPRTQRVSPGHLVAVATVPDGPAVVVWRWYDAVVLGEESHEQRGLVRMWEPAHGEVLATPRRAQQRVPGTRAYLSAGLPGAEWWVAGPVVTWAGEADVELDEVARLFTERGLWDALV